MIRRIGLMLLLINLYVGMAKADASIPPVIPPGPWVITDLCLLTEGTQITLLGTLGNCRTLTAYPIDVMVGTTAGGGSALGAAAAGAAGGIAAIGALAAFECACPGLHERMYNADPGIFHGSKL